MNTQPFYTSKTFWTLVLGLATFIMNAQFGWDIPESVIGFVMGILALIFRWSADQPLSTK
jgi:hypothetical protein